MGVSITSDEGEFDEISRTRLSGTRLSTGLSERLGLTGAMLADCGYDGLRQRITKLIESDTRHFSFSDRSKRSRRC